VTDDRSEEPNRVVSDQVESVKADIAMTRGQLEEAVNELSNRLNPKVQAHRATASMTDTARQTAKEAGSAAKSGLGRAQVVAGHQAARAKQAGSGRGLRSALVGLVVVIGVFVVARRRRGRGLPC
jgi:Protein of unknown function (DUF3618)